MKITLTQFIKEELCTAIISDPCFAHSLKLFCKKKNEKVKKLKSIHTFAAYFKKTQLFLKVKHPKRRKKNFHTQFLCT